MRDLISEASPLGVLLEETRGVVGVVLGTSGGELRTVIGSFVEGDATAHVAAMVTGELNTLGTLLGLGELGVASLKAPTAARVFAQQSGAVLAIELDPKRPLGELENKLRTLSWAPPDERRSAPTINRAPTVPVHERAGNESSPPPLPPPPAGPPPVRPDDDETDLSVPVVAPDAPRVSARATRPPPFAAGGIARPAASNGSPTRPLAAPEVESRPAAAKVSQRLRPPTPTPPILARITPASIAPGGPSTATGPISTSSPTTGPIPTTGPNASSPPSVKGAAVRAPAPASLSARVRAVGGGPVFTGDLAELCLPDLLEFLRNSHRSGLLMCTTSAGIGTVQLSRGMIIGASSPNALDLREHFLTSPTIGADQRRALAALPAEYFADELLDGGMVSRDLVPADEMEQARVARIYSAFREMMQWTAGRFSFDPGVAVVTNPALALSAQSILMHIYQEQDEQGR